MKPYPLALLNHLTLPVMRIVLFLRTVPATAPSWRRPLQSYRPPTHGPAGAQKRTANAALWCPSPLRQLTDDDVHSAYTCHSILLYMCKLTSDSWARIDGLSIHATSTSKRF